MTRRLTMAPIESQPSNDIRGIKREKWNKYMAIADYIILSMINLLYKPLNMCCNRRGNMYEKAIVYSAINKSAWNNFSP